MVDFLILKNKSNNLLYFYLSYHTISCYNESRNWSPPESVDNLLLVLWSFRQRVGCCYLSSPQLLSGSKRFWIMVSTRITSDNIHPTIQTYNLSFRVCVMCLRTTTENRGGNRLALCCSPTLTWYDPHSHFYLRWRFANYTCPPPGTPSLPHMQFLM